MDRSKLHIESISYKILNISKSSKLVFLKVTAYEAQNKHGLKNMVGNAWEWTADWWDTKHSKKAQENPVSVNVLKVAKKESGHCILFTLSSQLYGICSVF